MRKTRNYTVWSNPSATPMQMGAGATAPAPADRQPEKHATSKAAGLSKLHTVTDPAQTVPSITYYKGASLIDISGSRSPDVDHGKRSHKRREIRDWSNSSRARLKQKLAMILVEKMIDAIIITLTYPGEFPTVEEFKFYKNHLRVLLQGLRRRFPELSGIWKLEFQRRGAPHFHILGFGLKRECLLEVRAWITTRWFEIAHNGDAHQGKAGCQVDFVRSRGGAMSYMSKYVSKKDQTLPGFCVGRYWGSFGELPLGSCKELQLTERQAVKLRRWARKKMEKDVNNSRWNKFLLEDGKSFRKPPHGSGFTDVAKNAWTLGGREYWKHMLSCYHGGRRRKEKMKAAIWMQISECGALWNTSYTSSRMVIDMYRPPGRWKAKRNDRVKLICDADAFMACIERGMERGIL